MSLSIGCTLMCEQSPPTSLVTYARKAEEVGFPFAVMSDHFNPWLDEQGHSPNAWVTLGAVAQATQALELMTYVTCPIGRYHPTVVAQQAATLGVLSGGRFSLGLGAGENLNEHVVGEGWDPVNVRHEAFSEALQIINELFDGGYVNFVGDHYRVDSAKLWDLPEVRVPIGVAVSGPQSIEVAAPWSDFMIAVEPDADAVANYDEAVGANSPARKVGQLPISWDSDRERAVTRAHEQFRWFAGGWKVNAELPGPSAFDAATQFVRPEDVADQIACGDDIGAVVEAVRPFAEAGFTDLALLQIGDEGQDRFFEAAPEILAALQQEFGD
ncbi:TIGR03557 family F420-dependent LLM class oxidoreductase [Aeromicrobium tamlense]|uniref:G6PDH family F420-dependent oxidoreductase n=1 Tax=Aeromicrobium tamlense TaxID=375541 RepID=A0A8I0FVQ6_9ACTN|nr:TIGR03557 family F420-dependent LLM class oxidoreductase [Aeromicrobium tamlense]MBD1270628.1 TIGR03557 family F420-dependent LLM class oxidoreductase [Aeromicrobium tamlense]MBD1271240.1 TIGR03557 family F420-dependent LLM class oxidoreductase [Aeromicrobium tamlense]NYI38015.1 G6PDH family F420-dependent oxidoreductase [Aeromicrobium tamlense]